MTTSTGARSAARAEADAVQRDLGSSCEVAPAGPHDAVAGVAPALVARPASTEQVRAVMAAAARHDLAVVARGAGTKLAWGRPPERVDLVVDTTAMSAVLDHAAGDLIVEVEAGARLEQVNAVVAAAGQRLALDATHPGATVGGTLGANASGPLRRSVGTARDLMIGCSVVRADGVLSHAGGRVVKNVAGYDVGKLTIGSLGTLAVITRAVFRLHPLPPARALVSVEAEPTGAGVGAAVHGLVHAVVHSQLVPAAVEVDQDGDGPARVQVLLEGTEGGVAARTRALLALLGEDAQVGQDVPQGWGAPPFPDGGTGMKLTFALSGLGAVLGALAAAGAATGLRPAVRGSAGSGVLMVGLGADAEPGPVAEVLARVRAVCGEHGGAAVVLTAPPAVEAALAALPEPAGAWGPVPAIALMRAVKERFDPERRLAPGRFVGGI